LGYAKALGELVFAPWPQVVPEALWLTARRL
jgi:hypothetical protein